MLTMEDETGKTKDRILKKVASRIQELQIKRSLEPDVIVIHDDQSLLFEAQNLAALQLLIKRCGLTTEGITLPERVAPRPVSQPQPVAQKQ